MGRRIKQLRNEIKGKKKRFLFVSSYGILTRLQDLKDDIIHCKQKGAYQTEWGHTMWAKIWDWLNEDISKFVFEFFRLDTYKEDK